MAFPHPFRKSSRARGRDWQDGQNLVGMGSRWYLGGHDGLQTRLSTMCKVTGDFNGVRGAAKVGVHPVGPCSRAGQEESGVVSVGPVPETHGAATGWEVKGQGRQTQDISRLTDGESHTLETRPGLLLECIYSIEQSTRLSAPLAFSRLRLPPDLPRDLVLWLHLIPSICPSACIWHPCWASWLPRAQQQRKGCPNISF